MIKIENGEVMSTSEGMVVRRKGQNGGYRRMTALPADKPEDFEEVWMEAVKAAEAEAELRGEYRQRVNALVRERYDTEEELALLRKAIAGNGDAEEFDEYNAYVEGCKARAREELTATNAGE